MSDPHQVRDQLANLLTAVENDPELHAELERAKREFFGVDRPDAAVNPGGEASAIRFAEWYLCERPSDLLGEIPARIAAERFGPGIGGELLQESIVGVFLVQSSSEGRLAVRDVVDNRALDLCAVPDQPAVGDVLIGRLFVSTDEPGSYVPSPAMTIIGASPHVAIAFQRDVRNLEIDRRLTQAELEHLLFREGFEQQAEPPPPLERLEADLDRILAVSGKTDVYTATAISESIRSSMHPGAIIDGLLEEMAFDTDTDLEALRHLLLSLAASAPATQPSAEAEAEVETEQESVEVKVRPAAKPTKFRPIEGEKLGEQLARRIEEGLAGNEPIEELFADVESIFGEQIDDDEEEIGAFDDGDLDPLVREFVWELEIDPDDRERLEQFIQSLRRAPVPRTTVESLDTDDASRFLLQTWLDTPPQQRVAEVRATHAVLRRFLDWAESTQDLDRRSILDIARRSLIDEAERLHSAAIVLSPSTQPVGTARMFAIEDVTADVVYVNDLESDQGLEVPARDDTGAMRAGDVVLGTFDTEAGSFDGMVIALPGELRHLLG